MTYSFYCMHNAQARPACHAHRSPVRLCRGPSPALATDSSVAASTGPDPRGRPAASSGPGPGTLGGGGGEGEGRCSTRLARGCFVRNRTLGGGGGEGEGRCSTRFIHGCFVRTRNVAGLVHGQAAAAAGIGQRRHSSGSAASHFRREVA